LESPYFAHFLTPGSRAANLLNASKQFHPDVLNALAAAWGGFDPFEGQRRLDGAIAAKDVIAVYEKVAAASGPGRVFTVARIRQLHILATHAASAVLMATPELPQWAVKKPRNIKTTKPIEPFTLVDVLSALNHFDLPSLEILHIEVTARIGLLDRQNVTPKS
jgi:hypothetical protein